MGADPLFSCPYRILSHPQTPSGPTPGMRVSATPQLLASRTAGEGLARGGSQNAVLGSKALGGQSWGGAFSDHESSKGHCLKACLGVRSEVLLCGKFGVSVGSVPAGAQCPQGAVLVFSRKARLEAAAWPGHTAQARKRWATPTRCYGTRQWQVGSQKLGLPCSSSCSKEFGVINPADWRLPRQRALPQAPFPHPIPQVVVRHPCAACAEHKGK